MRLFFALFICALLLPAAPAQAAPRCFDAPGIDDCIDGRIGQFWEQQGGLAVFGYPLGPAQTEQTEQGLRLVQRFERMRLELHEENKAPYDVLMARLGVDALNRQGRDWTMLPRSAPGAQHFFAETGQAIAPEFWTYWSSHGLEFDNRRGTSFAESLALFGLPISPAQSETSPTDGGSYLTQWFERARFEYHPENAGTPYIVQLGLLESELGSGTQPIGPQAQLPPPPQQDAAPGGFIQASGGQLTRLGQVVRLKGVNYYPQWRPWADMWRGWDGPQIARELRLARDQLGINAVRVLVPYNFSGGRDGLGKITPKLIERLQEITQIAGDLDMRLIVTLFDFYVNFEQPDSPNYERDVAYVRTIVGMFANDERILAWDIHNEPDHYGAWEDRPDDVLNWLGRMADEIHAIAPNQLVTVGMGQHSNLWQPGPDGRRVIDYSDLVSVHIYDAGAAARQLDDVRAQTQKPMIVEEFGWPTDPPCIGPNYTEATQAQLYRDILGAARERTSGSFAWTLRDYDQARTMRWDSREEHFGLYRADDTLKPAAELFRAEQVPALPSTTKTTLPLTTGNASLPDHGLSALPIPGTPFHVKGVFRRAWETKGGRESFGLPISDAFERMPDKRIVQYFQRAVLEIDPNADDTNGYDDLPEDERIRLSLLPQALGAAALGAAQPGEVFPVGEAFNALYTRIDGEWRLGRALTPERVETVDGAPTRVQYFERGRLEWDATTQSAVISALGGQAWQGYCALPK